MGAALGWGLFTGSSVLLGGVIALRRPPHRRALGLIMAFGAGVLISAVAYELVLEAFDASDDFRGVAIGLTAGALVFYFGDLLIDRRGGHGRKDAEGSQQQGDPLGIVLGIVLDGVPESVVIGVTLAAGQTAGAAMIVAVFLSNLPESMSATTGLLTAGWTQRSIIWLWTAVTVVAGLSSWLGYAVIGDASGDVVAIVLGFAGGAILTMLADTMMPEAFEQEGRAVGLATTLGFALSFLVVTLE
jgi:ZIP family zinc transporter